MRPPGILLAPMAGITDAATRAIARRYGAEMCVTEMISAKGLLYHNAHTEELLLVSEEEPEVIVQIFGSDPGAMREGAQRVQELLGSRLYGIDINMGCPAPKIFSNGEGSALMANPDLAAAIVQAVKNASDVPVSVKMRSGISKETVNAVPFAKTMEDAGADWLTIHGRTRDQQYSGNADWNILENSVKHIGIPVIGSGDVRSAEDARRMRQETGCAGVMIGRAAIGNPFLFAQIQTDLRGERWKPPTAAERIQVLKEHLEREIRDKGERRGILEMRAQMPKYLRGLPGACDARARLLQMRDTEAICELLDGFAEQNSGCQIP